MPQQTHIYGEASGPMVVYASLHPEDSDAWKRLVNPEHPASDLEVPVQVGGNIEGSYPRQNTVDVALARQAGEHFIRTGQLDPALTWEEGPEMFDRLPPTRLHR